MIIAEFGGDFVQLVEGDQRFEKGLRAGQRFQFVVRGHHLFVRVRFDFFSAMVGNGFGEEAWAVKVDVRIEMIGQEAVDQWCVSLGDMSVSEMFADDRSVL